MKEVDIQLQIVKDVRKAGGWAEKMSNAFKAGMPDLVFKLTDKQNVCFIELKLISFPKIKSTTLKMDKLTALQRLELDKMQRAGILCGWAVVSKVDKRWAVVLGSNTKVEEIPQEDFLNECLYKGVEGWPVTEMYSDLWVKYAATGSETRHE